MNNLTNKTGLEILELTAGLKTRYGKNNLARMIWRELRGISIQQVKDLLKQLVDKGYLKEVNIGIHFAVIVVELTEKGKEALTNKEEIPIDIQKFYTMTFKPGTDIGVIDLEVIEEFYHIKKELIALQKREEELKETIKKGMTEKNVGEIRNAFMDLYCKNAEKVFYPKEKIERLVPEEILEKIRIINKSIVLIAKLKELNG